MTMTIEGYIGIDVGTQGISVVFTDTDLRVVSQGDGTYDFVSGDGGGGGGGGDGDGEFVDVIDVGCYEQRAHDWLSALHDAVQAMTTFLHETYPTPQQQQQPRIQVLSIGIAGQMHGEVLCDANGNVLAPVRLWCDARNDKESDELTTLFQCKIPKRSTCARFLWTCRNRRELARQVKHVTTPAGWIAQQLTGEFNLGIGDASGMFPVDYRTHNYIPSLLEKFDTHVNDTSILPLSTLLPKVIIAGENAGHITDKGAELLLGLELVAGVPVAAAEGDQVAALAGSCIGVPGMVSCSFGTSVCCNLIADERLSFTGVSSSVDHFSSADGRPIHMVWLRNGTTFLNTIVASYGGSFTKIMPEIIKAPSDCNGVLTLPFMDDEPGLRVTHGGIACIVGLNASNATVGNVGKAALLSAMFNLRLGCDVLDQQGYPRTEIILSGGLAKTPECGQILADVFDTPVSLFKSAEEGCSWGAAVLSKYRHLDDYQKGDWLSFLASIAEKNKEMRQRFHPNPSSVAEYKQVMNRYKALVDIHPHLSRVMNESK